MRRRPVPPVVLFVLVALTAAARAQQPNGPAYELSIPQPSGCGAAGAGCGQ